jgi:hypothetical protein
MSAISLGVRWTMGDVSDEGFEALRLSLWGAFGLFGPDAAYAVCVNTVSVEEAKRRTGAVPQPVVWREATRELPPFLLRHFDGGLAEGVGWKFAPLIAFPERHELSLDNDCILWGLPSAVRAWLAGEVRGVLAADVRACFGQFSQRCGPEPRNLGIRGIPARFDLEAALERLLEEVPVILRSELDEQGMQVAALASALEPAIVRVDEVSICSPFPPHLPGLGSCGAHFVGLNARALPWSLEGRPASEYVRAHWRRHRDELYARVGIDPVAAGRRA